MEVGLLVLLATAIVLFVFISLLARRTSRLDRQYFVKSWRQIEDLAKTGEGGLEAAIVRADKTLDQALKQAKIPGTKMAERLREAEPRLRDKEAVWRAHKLRNRLVHDSHVKLNRRTVNQTLAAVLRALKDLGAL